MTSLQGRLKKFPELEAELHKAMMHNDNGVQGQETELSRQQST
jgi:hypothetical protein